MAMWGRLRFVPDLLDTFLTLRVWAHTTESVALARANGIDAGR